MHIERSVETETKLLKPNICNPNKGNIKNMIKLGEFFWLNM